LHEKDHLVSPRLAHAQVSQFNLDLFSQRRQVVDDGQVLADAELFAAEDSVDHRFAS
jgi:hypothetical protein